MDAIRRVIDIADRTGRGSIQEKNLCAVVALDVNNSFNSVPWPLIDKVLRMKKVPESLTKVLRSYMSKQKVLVECKSGYNFLDVSCDVHKVSVLGPTIWNLFYDGPLNLDLPHNTHLIAFTDDVAVNTDGHNKFLLEESTYSALERVSD